PLVFRARFRASGGLVPEVGRPRLEGDDGPGAPPPQAPLGECGALLSTLQRLHVVGRRVGDGRGAVGGVGRLELTLACGDYDRTRAIRIGEVKPDGVELNVITLAPEEMFYRMARFREFDVSELSLSTYTVLRGRGEPLVAIPVFPSFSFRPSSVFVGTRAGIKDPRDLIGKRMGVPKYHMTAAVWIRGMLEEEYGVAPKDMRWFEGGEGSKV